MAKTLINLFLKSVELFPENPMIWEKTGEKYCSTTYKDSLEKVQQTAAGLMQMGFKKGERVILLSEGRNDWVFSELGVLFAGGINVPLSVKLQEPTELRFRIAHSGARFAIVSERQLSKVMNIKNDLPDLEKIIVLDSYEEKDDDLLAITDVRASGSKYLKENADECEKRWQSIKGDDNANICYTSGTTADPKGIVLTHRNYTANVEQARALFDVPDEYVSLIILPWDHAFAHTCGIYTLISAGASMAAIELGKTPLETVKNIGKNIKETQPHFIMSVPALSDNFKRNIERGIAAKGNTVEKLFRFALKVAYAYHGDGFRNGKWQGIGLLKPIHNLFTNIIFSKIHEQFGGRLGFFVGGGALLDVEYQRFFAAIGIPVYQGFGLTEAAPVISANKPTALKMGSSGTLVPNLEIKICDEDRNELPKGQKGEIVVKGENVMKEYWRNPEATKDTIIDGWLYTGDLGYMDNDDYLIVLGRYKSLLISDDGEKFSPEGIEESLIGQCPYILQVMLYNNQKHCTTALIVPNKQAILDRAKAEGWDLETDEGQKAVITLYVDTLKSYQKDPHLKKMFAGKWVPSTFALLGEQFTEANRFLNSTMKMVRWRITQYYQDRIDYMYTPEGMDPYNHQNKTIVNRFVD